MYSLSVFLRSTDCVGVSLCAIVHLYSCPMEYFILYFITLGKNMFLYIYLCWKDLTVVKYIFCNAQICKGTYFFSHRRYE